MVAFYVYPKGTFVTKTFRTHCVEGGHWIRRFSLAKIRRDRGVSPSHSVDYLLEHAGVCVCVCVRACVRV